MSNVLKLNSKNCPVGEFQFAAITGTGMYNEDKEANEYKVTLQLDMDEHSALMDDIDDFVEDNAVKGKTLHSVGYQTHEDYDGIPEGKFWIQAKTATEFEGKDGVKAVDVNIYDATGNKCTLPDGVGIGKGSTGIVIGQFKIWDRKKEYGCSLYLSGVQIADFIPHEFESAPEAIGTGSFKGFDNNKSDLEKAEEPEQEETTARPRRSRRSR